MNWISNLLGKKSAARTPLPIVVPPVTGPVAGPLALDPPAVWVAAICQTQDKAQALTWTQHLEGDVWLVEVAQKARSAEIRYAAARRIQDGVALERLSQTSRDKDKRVYRHCIESLRRTRLVQDQVRLAEKLEEELHAQLAQLPLFGPRLLELKKQIEALDDAQACRDLLQQGMDRLRAESEARRELHTNQLAAVSLAAECERAIWPWDPQIEAWHPRFAALVEAHAQMPTWLALDPAARALKLTLCQIESLLDALAQDADRAHACANFLSEIESVSPRAAAIDPVAAWAELAKPLASDALQPLLARWEAVQASVPIAASEPPTVVRKPALIELASVHGQLEQVEQAIELGHLVEAEAAMKQLKATLGAQRLETSLTSHVHELQAKLLTLHGWARWGTGQAREQLVAAAQELLQGERGTDELALAIPALREAWKQLNAHGPAGKGQWEQFDSALEQAYRPVAALRAEQAARQAEALVAREALCLELETEVTSMTWEDYKQVEARRLQMIQRWRALPHAGFRDERNLRRRFDALIAGIDLRLDAARVAECERREQLIAAAAALSGQSDLKQAMAEAKALQGRWSAPAPRLKRGDEVRLWQRFRAACDSVFARQDALRSAQETQRQERDLSRQKLLDDFAAASTSDDASTLNQALTRFRRDWDGSRPARQGGDPLDLRALELQQQVQQRLDNLHHAKSRERLEQLLGQARKSALAAASQLTAADLASGREVRASLLLDLEIALALPSPDGQADMRRERQLAQLQRRFGAEPAEPPETLLLRCCATAAPQDEDFDRRIAAVIGQLAGRG